jgi:site-specific DNA recombinase
MAEMEREKIAERTVRGRLSRVRDGKLLPGSRPPYGYQWRDSSKGALDLDPATAPVVQRMYEHIASGGSLRSVVAQLRANAVPTATGQGQWHAQTVRDMLLRQHYCGRAVAWGWRKRSKGKPQQFDAAKAIPLPEGTVPAIVSEELWEAVQQRLQLNQARATRSAKNPEAALLRGGYVVCGHCGRTLQARPRSDGGTQYVCARGKRYGDCPGTVISGHQLDGAIWSRVRDILQDPDLLRHELERRKDADPTPHQLATAERTLVDLERRGANIARGIAQMDDEEAARPLLEKLTELRRSRIRFEAEITEIKTQQARLRDAQLAVSNLADWTRTVGANLDRLTWKERRLVLDALGVRLTVFPHGHEPRFVIDAEIPIEVVSPTTSGTPACRSSPSSAWRG